MSEMCSCNGFFMDNLQTLSVSKYLKYTKHDISHQRNSFFLLVKHFFCNYMFCLKSMFSYMFLFTLP